MRSHPFHHPLTVVLLAVGVSNVRAQIPEGFEVVRLTNSENPDRWPRINDRSEVVWTEISPDGLDADILRYRAGTTTQLSDELLSDQIASINGCGRLAWMRGTPPDAYDLVVYDEGEMTTLAGLPEGEWAPVINDAGQVAWVVDWSGDFTHADLFFYDGKSVMQITENAPGFAAHAPAINSSGDITWFVRNTFLPFEATLMLYRDGNVFELTDGTTSVRSPDINDAGQIVWDDEFGIWMLENGVVTHISSNPADANPRINNYGDIVFNRFHPEIEAWQIWAWLDGEFMRITENTLWNTNPDISDRGEIVWGGGPSSLDKEIFMMRRVPDPGDFDGDSDVDWVDFGAFQVCFNTSVFESVCSMFDFDYDNEIDLEDYQEFLGVTTDPQGRDAYPPCSRQRR